MAENKKMCGLWHVHVNTSERNLYGLCACLRCFGTHCHDCETYRILQWENIDAVGKTRCQLCQGYTEKTK